MKGRRWTEWSFAFLTAMLGFSWGWSDQGVDMRIGTTEGRIVAGLGLASVVCAFVGYVRGGTWRS